MRREMQEMSRTLDSRGPIDMLYKSVKSVLLDLLPLRAQRWNGGRAQHRKQAGVASAHPAINAASNSQEETMFRVRWRLR